MVSLSKNKRAHGGKRLNHSYPALKGASIMALDGAELAAKPIVAARIRPKYRYRAMGLLRIVNVPASVPGYDLGDEWFD